MQIVELSSENLPEKWTFVLPASVKLCKFSKFVYFYLKPHSNSFEEGSFSLLHEKQLQSKQFMKINGAEIC